MPDNGDGPACAAPKPGRDDLLQRRDQISNGDAAAVLQTSPAASGGRHDPNPDTLRRLNLPLMTMRLLPMAVVLAGVLLPLPAWSEDLAAGGRSQTETTVAIDTAPGANPPTTGGQAPESTPPAQAASSRPAKPLWRATLWAGTMVDEDLLDNGVNLDLFLAQGQTRDEVVYGVGLQRQLWSSRNGVGSLLIDANLLGHSGRGQQDGRYANPNQSYSNNQTFLEGTLGVAFKVNPWSWLGLSVIEGISGLSTQSNYEATYRKDSAQVLNYLAFEAELGLSRNVAAVFRIHHRSGVGGVFSGVTSGSNGYLGGLRVAF